MQASMPVRRQDSALSAIVPADVLPGTDGGSHRASSRPPRLVDLRRPRRARIDSWIWPLFGLLFLPWTTIAYLIVWSPVVGVDGIEWIVVALGFAADVLTYSGRAAASRYETSRGY